MIDKVKAYDEALENAKKLRDDCQKELDKTDKNSRLADLLRSGIGAVEIIFPQLRESDDERVRKDIIDHFESIKIQALYDNQEESDNIISSCNEKIAYLEKQKENQYFAGYVKGYSEGQLNPKQEKQKYDRMQPVYDNQESFESALDKAWKFYNESGSRTVDSCEDDYIECAHAKGFREGYLFGLEKQKEWEPIDWSKTKINGEPISTENNSVDIPLVEWSEKDEKMCQHIISDLREFRDCETDEELISDYEKEITWLKDISQNHKKCIEAVDKLCSNEWSEEDEKSFNNALSGLKYAYEDLINHESFDSAEDVKNAFDWLKDIFLNHKKHNEAVNKLCFNEWSEEDEKDITHIIEILDDCYASGRHDLSKTNHENLVNKLKSLHPSWKPSKKQMDALKNVAYGAYQNGDGPALRELHEQLLKLGVKKEQN